MSPAKAAELSFYVASEGVFAGAIVISDTVKTAEEAIKRMKQAGVKKCVMLTEKPGKRQLNLLPHN